VKRISPAILETILKLNRQGAKLIVQDGWPTEVPGYFQHQTRHESLRDLTSGQAYGKTIVEATGSILPSLASQGIAMESMTSSGLRFVRRTHDSGYHYFIVNRSDKPFNGILPLAVHFQSALILDPWNAQAGRPALSQNSVALRLEPGQSIIIRTFTDRKIEGTPLTAAPVSSQAVAIDGPWKIQFIEGGPTLPAPADNLKLGSWTTLAGAADFSGTARYTTTFELPSPLPASCQLDLGRVAHTARVSLNGKLLGISWCAPHVVDLTNSLKAGSNLLEVEVTNLAANRIADLDRRKIPWKQFHEINFVNIDYKLFDASAWPPMDSGLIGPVNLLLPSTP
jgi:hypothetical protein